MREREEASLLRVFISELRIAAEHKAAASSPISTLVRIVLVKVFPDTHTHKHTPAPPNTQTAAVFSLPVSLWLLPPALALTAALTRLTF